MSATALQITVEPMGAIGALAVIGNGEFVDELRRPMGEAVAQALRTHFEELQAERSGKAGGTPTNFWIEVRDSVQQPKVEGADIDISINHVGLAQRYFGGTIHAGKGISSATGEPTKFLAIPVDVESYGKRPADFPEGALQYIVGPAGPALILAEHTDRIATKGKNKGKAVPARGDQEATHGAGSVLFVLRESVTQKPDPSVLPTEAALTAAAVAAGDEQAQRILDRLAEGAPAGNH